jgi:hypothetical protein
LSRASRAFKNLEHSQSFFWGQQVEQNVMLRTHTHVLADCLHILTEHVVPIDVSLTVGGLQHPSHHLNRGSFASTIVAKQCKNLPLVHADIDPVDSFESIAELLF